MPSWGYLIIAICLIVALAATFIISFAVYRKTPVPKGCENLEINEENCANCHQLSCPMRKEREGK